MIAATIFLVCFAVLAGLVMYLSQTIEHGEARFDADGKVIKDQPASAKQASTSSSDATPAKRLDGQLDKETPNKSTGTKDDE